MIVTAKLFWRGVIVGAVVGSLWGLVISRMFFLIIPFDLYMVLVGAGATALGVLVSTAVQDVLEARKEAKAHAD